MRNRWEIEISISDILKQAVIMRDVHKGRQNFWSNESSKAEEELRKNGIEIREHQVSGGQQLRPMFDPERMQRLEECRNKVAEHKRAGDDYQAHVKFLELAEKEGKISMTLDIDDVKYFGF